VAAAQGYARLTGEQADTRTLTALADGLERTVDVLVRLGDLEETMADVDDGDREHEADDGDEEGKTEGEDPATAE